MAVVRLETYAQICCKTIFRLVSTLLVAKYIHNFGRKTMYFISAATTILFQVLFGVIDILDLGYTWKICPLIVICGQVTF